MLIHHRYPIHAARPICTPGTVAVAPLAPVAMPFAGDSFTRVGGTASTIAASAAIRDAEKLAYPEGTAENLDKFNAKRAAKNEKLAGEVQKVESEAARVAADPSISPAKKAKKLEALEKKAAKLRSEIRPPLDLQKVTHEIDAIANDPSLSNDEKKKAIEEVRKREGMPKRGAISMRTVTQQLSRAEKGHAKRMGAAAAEARKDAKRAEQIYGKGSPAHLAALARSKSFDEEHKDASERGKFLGSLYPKPSFWGKIGGFFKKVGKGIAKVGKGVFKVAKGVFSVGKKILGGIGKIARFAMPILRGIPGFGQVASLAGFLGL